MRSRQTFCYTIHYSIVNQYSNTYTFFSRYAHDTNRAFSDKNNYYLLVFVFCRGPTRSLPSHVLPGLGLIIHDN